METDYRHDQIQLSILDLELKLHFTKLPREYNIVLVCD